MASSLIAIGLAAVACGGESVTGEDGDFVHVQASSITFETLEDMARASEIIVLGSVIDVADGELHEALTGEDFTGTRDLAVRVQIERVLSGEVESGDMISIPWIGYEVAEDGSKGPQFVIDGQLPPVVGDRNVWFLGFGDGGDTFGLVAYAGRIEITDDETLLPFHTDSGAAQEVNGLTIDELKLAIDQVQASSG